MTDLSCKISFRSFFSLLSRLWFPAEAKIATEQFGRQNKTETRKNFFWKHFFWHFQLLRREWQQKQQLMGFERRSEYVWEVMDVLRCFRSVSALRRVCALLRRRRSSKNAKFLSLFVRLFIACSRAMLFGKSSVWKLSACVKVVYMISRKNSCLNY